MAWNQRDDHYPEHPKVLAAGPLAAWVHEQAFGYASRYLTDGFIPEAAARMFSVAGMTGIFVQVPGARGDEMRPAAAMDWPARLVDVGLWERRTGGYAIHDYLKYNPSREQVLSRREAAKQRASGQIRGSQTRDSQQPAANQKRINDEDHTKIAVGNGSDSQQPAVFPMPHAPCPHDSLHATNQEAAASKPRACAHEAAAAGRPPWFVQLMSEGNAEEDVELVDVIVRQVRRTPVSRRAEYYRKVLAGLHTGEVDEEETQAARAWLHKKRLDAGEIDEEGNYVPRHD